MKERLGEYMILYHSDIRDILYQMVDTGNPSGSIRFSDDGNLEFIVYLHHKFDKGKAWLQMYVTDANDNLIYKKVSMSQKITVDELKDELDYMSIALMYKILDHIDF